MADPAPRGNEGKRKGKKKRGRKGRVLLGASLLCCGAMITLGHYC